MTELITLSSLCQAFQLYRRADVSPAAFAEWRSYEWLWNGMTISQKCISFFGLFRYKPIRTHILFPLLLRSSVPYVQRYLDGDWRKQDEERLIELMACLTTSLQNDQLQHYLTDYFSAKYVEKLTAAHFELETFAALKERTVPLLTRFVDSQKALQKTSWTRLETFSQYKERLELLVKELEKKNQWKIASEQRLIERQDPKSVFKMSENYSDTEAYRKRIALFQEMDRSVKQYIDHIGYMREKKLVPVLQQTALMRVEAPEILQDAKILYDVSFTLQVQGENLLESILEALSGYEGDLDEGVDWQTRVDLADQELEKLGEYVALAQDSVDAIQSEVQNIAHRIDERLLRLFRLLDNQPLLPSTSKLRGHQLRLIKTGREKLKQYKNCLQNIPGPFFPLGKVEQELATLIELSQEFYREGIEIDRIRSGLQSLYHKMEQMLSTDSVEKKSSAMHSIEMMLEKILYIDRNLEILPDREQEYRMVLKGVAGFGDSAYLKNI